MAHRPTCYLIEHKRSGRALFSGREEAREWADYQSHYHHPGQAVRWISGGEHGWEAQRLSDGTAAATLYELKLDGTLPDYDADDWD